MSDLKEFIKSKRDSLGQSSITTYNSILKNLYKKVFGDEKIDTDKFNQHEKILDFLKELPPNKRKTILSALVVVTNKKEYREAMLDDIKNYNNEIKTQQKSETQKENWIDGESIKTKYNELRRTAEMLYKKSNLTPSDLQDIQNYIILAVLSGEYIPPRRSKDYVDFKIKNINKETDNYMDGNKFIFNSYKTAKTYGKQEVNIPPKLRNIIKKWSVINPTDYLLFDSKLSKLSNVKLTQRLNKIFGKKFAVNGLRHTTLTEKFGENMKVIKQLDETMKEMGSSAKMGIHYIKLDD
jgi:uncharacterized protein YfkK (UPF0435 family)